MWNKELSDGVSRRQFLRLGAMAGGFAAAPTLFSEVVLAQTAPTVVKATFGGSLCNFALLLSKEKDLAAADGVQLEFVSTANNADISTMFGAGLVDVSVLPYTNFMTLYEKGAPVKIVAGGGGEGCLISGPEEIKKPEDARGKILGTFQADTNEVLFYDWLQTAGMTFEDVDMRYFATGPELAQAFISGAIDVVCQNEPFTTKSLKERPGTRIISDGTDLYGRGYTDCVLAARTSFIEENPKALQALLKAMMTAQQQIEQDVDSAINATVGKYFKTDFEVVKIASSRQFPIVDQRGQQDFMIKGADAMIALGYLKEKPDANIFDWKPLTQAIEDNKALYDTLKWKS